jgi:hypothetical protein
VGEFLPHPSNPLYVPDGVTEGLPVLHGQEAHIGVPAIDWRGLDNPAEKAALARNAAREAERAAVPAPATPRVRSVKK